MVKSGMREALQQGMPIGYLPARAKYIHNTGCQVGGESLKDLKKVAPKELKNMSTKIMKYYEQQRKKQQQRKKKTNKNGRVPSKKSAKKGSPAKSTSTTKTKRNKNASDTKKKSTMKGGSMKASATRGGSMTKTFLNALTKPALSAVIVLLSLNQLANSYSKYKLKGGASKRSQHTQVEKFKKVLNSMKKNNLVKIAETLATLTPMKPSDKRYSQLTSVIPANKLKQAGGFHLNVNKLSVATLLFLLQQIIDKKWVQRGGGKKKDGCGCGSIPSNKTLYSELDRVINGMRGGSQQVNTAPRSHVYDQTQTGCMQPDWCAQCV